MHNGSAISVSGSGVSWMFGLIAVAGTCGWGAGPAAPVKGDSSKNYREEAGGAAIEMVWIPAGKFTMGSANLAELVRKYGLKEESFKHEQPAHEVALDAFWMGKFEVTNAQYRKFKASHFSGNVSTEIVSLNSDAQPVVRVSWDDAKAFCDWLSKKSGKTYALPTEAQWEYACRAGTKTHRYWGDDDEMMGKYANACDRTLEEKFGATFGAAIRKEFPDFKSANTTDGYAEAAPVGKFLPNAFGLHDMIGNVSEWCGDWYGVYYAASPAQNPIGPADGESRVLRGGSWLNPPWDCRSALRLKTSPAFRHDILGFRLARTQK